jgi:hypothetical protein
MTATDLDQFVLAADGLSSAMAQLVTIFRVARMTGLECSTGDLERLVLVLKQAQVLLTDMHQLACDAVEAQS